MNSYEIKTFSKAQKLSNPHFFILSKGINSGKPLKAPCPNCFIISCPNQDRLNHLYWLIFALWRTNAFHPYLRGSIISFIIKKDLMQVIAQADEKSNQNPQEFQKSINALKRLEQAEKLYLQNLKLIEDARKAIFYKYHRSFILH